MKQNVLVKLLFLITLTATCSSCLLFVDGTVGKGAVIEESISVSDFFKIENSSSAQVRVVKGD